MNRTQVVALALVVLLVGGLAAAVIGGTGALQEDDGLPDSMAAIGDSITRAAAVDPSVPEDSPLLSWATGDRPYSHRGRLIAAGATLGVGDVHNLSTSGARMSDAAAQARAAVESGAGYITFLMGANDACAPEMTSTAEFRDHFSASLGILMSGLPETQVFVASIPDIGHLWSLFADDERVTRVWEATGICPTILSARISDEERADAIERLHDFNRVLEEVCDAAARCTFDGGAVFDHRFEPTDVSTVDHFHPSVRGQQTLAEITWRAGPRFAR